jgi:dienelactone hydrolase
LTQATFWIGRDGEPDGFPATVWTPETTPEAAAPLVLLGHGGSGHRNSPRIVSLAAKFAESGFAAVAIDDPYHGERSASPLTPAEYQARIVAEGIGKVLDRMAADWLTTCDALAEAGIADRTSIAYCGLSLATRFGLPTAAALGPSLRCAVFGKFAPRSPVLPPGLNIPDRVLLDASNVSAPVLFHMQWDDELFPRAGQFELFDAFPDPAKELHAFPGSHARIPGHAPDAWHAFIARHLDPDAATSEC